MSLDNITSLAGKFATAVEASVYIDKQNLLLMQARDHILFLESEVKRLQNILNSVPSLLPKTNEELICEAEISKLMHISSQRNLTLEETKKLDLFVKNLYLAKDSKKDIKPDYKTLPQGFTEANLVEIASQPGEPVEAE